MTIATKTKFDCICNGCRNYQTRPAEIWHESQIQHKVTGHFFSPDTMRFFKSRVSDFKPVGISASGQKSLAVIVSSKWGDDSPRHYEIVVVCPYGEVTRESEEQVSGLVKYDSLRQARNSKTWNFQVPRDTFKCSCHGCQLDEQGR